MKKLQILFFTIIISNYTFAQNPTTNIPVQTSKDLFTIKKTPINSKLSDIGATFFNDKYIIYSSKKTGAIFPAKDKLTNAPFSTLYCVNYDANEELSKPSFFSYTLDSKGNEGGICFSNDKKNAYFTKTNNTDTKNFQLYKVDFDDQKYTWVNETPVDFNNSNYSIENPSLSADGKKIYFSSNKPGGYGGYDLYEATLNDKGIPTNPTNLGNTINTPADENYPYESLEGNGTIYFSSNTPNGFGGYDVFVSKKTDNTYYTPLNLGNTINSSNDDVAFILASKNSGFISSNKKGGEGLYDVYHFKRKQVPTIINGAVTELNSKTPLPNVAVMLIDKNGNTISTKNTDGNGNYSFEVSPLNDYQVAATKEGYEEHKSPSINTNKDVVVNIDLDQKRAILTDNAIVLENIYFDLDKHIIKKESLLSLNKVVTVLNENPNLNIIINAYTDSRASDKYNIILSKKRANEVKKQLIINGISKNRLESEGFGETKPLSNCGAKCSEKEFALDRRVEFIIKK